MVRQTLIGGRGRRDEALPTPVWRAAAFASLAVALVVTIAQRHDAPVGDAYDYIDAANHLTGGSRFPPGFPALLAPLTGSWWAMQALTLTIALGLVATIWWAAVRLGGWRSGVIASGLMLLSGGVVRGGSAIMSDRLGALLVVGALLALLYGRPVLAGLLMGLGGWVRLIHVAFCAALPRRAWLAAGATTVALVVWQLTVKGSLTGVEDAWVGLEQQYGSAFSPANITGPSSLEFMGNPAPTSNLAFYSGVLAVGHGHQLVPLLLILGAVGLWRHRGTTAVRFAAVVVAANLAVYLVFFFQSARYMLPAGCLLIVYAAAAVGTTRRPARGS